MTTCKPVAIDLDLIEQVHDVTLGRASWDEVLARLTLEFSTEATLLVAYGARPEEVRNLAQAGSPGRDGRPWSQYVEHFAAIDPFAAAMQGVRFPAGLILTGDDVVPAEEFCASEYYNDWFKPNGLRYTAGAFTPTRDGRLVQMGLPRAPRAGAYTPEEVARLQRYFNHIRRALLAQEEILSRALDPDFDQVARAFGLTPAEARLIEGLARHGSLRHTAAALNRSYYTLRAQLRAVFRKTGTNSQNALMRLIHRDQSDTRGPAADGPGES